MKLYFFTLFSGLLVRRTNTACTRCIGTLNEKKNFLKKNLSFAFYIFPRGFMFIIYVSFKGLFLCLVSMRLAYTPTDRMNHQTRMAAEHRREPTASTTMPAFDSLDFSQIYRCLSLWAVLWWAIQPRLKTQACTPQLQTERISKQAPRGGVQRIFQDSLGYIKGLHYI